MLTPISIARSGFIASGQVGWPHHASGAVRSGHLSTTGTPDGTKFLRDDFSWAAAGGGLASGAVGSGYMASGAVQGFFGTTRHVASGTLGVFDLGSGAVVAGTVGSGAIVSGNIASGQIGTSHIAVAGVTSGNIGSGQLTTFHVASGGLLSGALGSGQIGNSHLGSGAVLSGHIASGQIGTNHIASGRLTGFELGSGAIVSGRIASGQIGTAHLADGAVTSGDIASGQVTTFHVNSGGLLSGAIGSGQIGNAHLGSGSVLSGHIASGQVGQFHISSGAVTSGRLGVAGTPNGTLFLRDDFSWAAAGGGLSSGAVGSGYVASGAVQGFFGVTRHIASGTVGSFDLGSGAVVAGSVGSGAVVSGNIASGQVDTYKFASGATITRAQFVGPFVSGSSWTVITEEMISGVRAVALSQSGNLRIAMAGVSGRMPAIGVVVDNVLSGIGANVYTDGNFQFSSGLVNYSGYLGQQVFVGRSGQLVTASGWFNSGGLLSGDITQAIGVAFNSGACQAIFDGPLPAIPVDYTVCEGRLTTETGVPISTSDRSSQSTIYFTPYNGNRIALFNGVRWQLYAFTECSLALSGLTSGKNYDVFLYDNAGTLTLELSAAWTNDTTRADALTTQDGVYVKSGSTTRRWLGTIRTTGTTTTADVGGSGSTPAQRFVWNAYNQVPRHLHACPGYSDGDAPSSYTTTSTTWTQANGGTGAKAEWVQGGVGNVPLSANSLYGNSGANNTRLGIGVDSPSSTVAAATVFGTNAVSASVRRSVPLTAGYHYAALLISVSAGTGTYYADDARYGSSADPYLTYLAGELLC